MTTKTASRDRVQAKRDDNGSSATGSWDLRLYIAGSTPNSIRALANLKRICEEHLKGLYHIEVVDLLKHPTLARGEMIIAVPTLVRKIPLPIRQIIGDLSETEKVLIGLDIRESDPKGRAGDFRNETQAG